MYQPFTSVRALAHQHVLRGGSIMPVVEKIVCKCGIYVRVIAPTVSANRFIVQLVDETVLILVAHSEHAETLPLLLYPVQAYPFICFEQIDLFVNEGEVCLFIPSGQFCREKPKADDSWCRFS